MVEVKSITVKPSVLALLRGDIEMTEVRLVEPRIVLEINAEGKPNWEFTPSAAEAKPQRRNPSSPKPLSLGRLTIENGTLIFSDSKAGLSMVAEKADVTASVGSIERALFAGGGATMNGSPLKIDLSGGEHQGLPPAAPSSVALAAGGGKLGLKGTIERARPCGAAVGHRVSPGWQDEPRGPSPGR